MSFFNSKQANAERLAKEIESQSSTNNINSMKKWWNTKSSTEKGIIIGILAAAIASPFIIAMASKLTVVSVTGGAVNATGTQAVFTMTKVAAPLWHKILWASFMITATGVSTAFIAASFNGPSVNEIIDKNV